MHSMADEPSYFIYIYTFYVFVIYFLYEDIISFSAACNNGREQKPFLLRIKLQGNSYNFDNAESEHGNQVSISPTIVNYKIAFVMKRQGVDIKLQYKTSNNERSFYVRYPS